MEGLVDKPRRGGLYSIEPDDASLKTATRSNVAHPNRAARSNVARRNHAVPSNVARSNLASALSFPATPTLLGILATLRVLAIPALPSSEHRRVGRMRPGSPADGASCAWFGVACGEWVAVVVLLTEAGEFVFEGLGYEPRDGRLYALRGQEHDGVAYLLDEFGWELNGEFGALPLGGRRWWVGGGSGTGLRGGVDDRVGGVGRFGVG